MRIEYRPMDPLAEPAPAKVFFALWPAAAERGRLAAWLHPLRKLCGGREMRGETLHCTLVFIGEVAQSGLEDLCSAAREAGGVSFELSFDQAHYWEHNHIVYAAPGRAPQQLRQLVDNLQKRLTARGFNFDRREYQPHVTLLRNARRAAATLPELQPVRWQIRDFALVRSVQRDGQQGGRASYQVLARFPLQAG